VCAWAQLQHVQPQLHLLTWIFNYPSPSKPCTPVEGGREKEKAARNVGRSEDGENRAADLRQESKKFSL